MGVGRRLVQSVVYRVLSVMMSTNIEENAAVSEEGHVLTASAAVLAQSVERVTAEREVAGSIPGAGPILMIRVLK